MKNPPAAWDSRPTAQQAEIRDVRARGYFHDTSRSWDGTTWIRDYDELRRRDLALFALGDLQGRRVLDVACGDGTYMVVLARLGAQVSGQDIAPQAIARAQKNLADHGVEGRLEVGNAVALRFADDSFDAVFSADFLEHISEDEKRAFLAEVFRVLKPGGVFVAKTPNLSYLRLSVWVRRLKALGRARSPFRVHIEHTRNNPDSQHRGLTTYGRLRRLLHGTLFHSPMLVRPPLGKRPLPLFLQEALPGLSLAFNKDLIVASRKPLFIGFYP